ncbi:MAG: hypothetical protein IPK71_34765 [Myxococcales bacterium]|nr:hypothetical protein [Myxococcales bacterium]
MELYLDGIVGEPPRTLRRVRVCDICAPPMSSGDSPTNGKTNGAHVDPVAPDEPDDLEASTTDDEPLPEDELGPPPAVIAEGVSACVRYVHAKYGVLLDGTQDTLSLLDQYVRDARAEITAKPAALDLLALSAGAYLGEVMRREMGGTWFAEGDASGFRLYFSRVFLSFNPVGMVREALTLEPDDGFGAGIETDPAEREEVMARLRSLPDVDDDEFLLPTTRFDVVSIVYDHLRAKQIAAGTGDVRFTPDDY